MGNSNVYSNQLVTIKDRFVQWEKHTCFLSAVSMISIGKPITRNSKFAAAEKREGVNLELNSGSVTTFLSEDNDFLTEVYELLCVIVLQGRCEGAYTLDFRDSTIVYEEEEKEEEVEEVIPILEEEEKEKVQFIISPGGDSVRQELLILLENIKNSDSPNLEAKQLLEKIIICRDGNCSQLQELYHTFLQFSLINNCNELGLNQLIDEVKAKIFQ